jgi:molecular chaperone DnaJ
VQFHVAPHPVLKRDGFDLVYELPLNIAEAALGTEAQIPTLEGEERLPVPPGTQHGRVFRIREKGVPRLQRTGRGDFLVVARVEIPKTLTSRQRELLQALAQTFEGDPGSQDRGGDASATRTNGRASEQRQRRDRGLLHKVKDALGLDEE